MEASGHMRVFKFKLQLTLEQCRGWGAIQPSFPIVKKYTYNFWLSQYFIDSLLASVIYKVNYWLTHFHVICVIDCILTVK